VAGQRLPGVKGMAEVAMCERLIGMSLLREWQLEARSCWKLATVAYDLLLNYDNFSIDGTMLNSG